MRTAFRCRAYPDEAQRAMLGRTFGCVRVVWNRTLAARHKTLRHQHAAFHAFFGKRARDPRFKSRRGRQAAAYTRSAFTMRGGVLRLAKMSEPLRFTWTWPDVDVTGLEPTGVTVARDSDGRWFVTFHAEVPGPVPLPVTGRAVGIDLGLRRFAVTSDGHRIANPRHLAVRNMVRNRHLARAISDCGWAGFRRQLEYKCQRYGRELVVIDRWFPSSKTCSACGHLLATLSLATRTWQCPSCGTRHDRDINAAKNILAAGQAVTACGDGVRHPGSSRMQPSAKQEPRPVTAGIPVRRGGE